MLARWLVVASIVTGLCTPVAARAGGEPPFCVPAPVDTVGAHAEVGEKEVHLPAISDARLCAVMSPPVGQTAPIRLTLQPDCGLPCFVLVVEDRSWTIVSTRVQAYLTYSADDTPVYRPLADVPVYVGVDNPNPVCVAVGNPIPECPPGSVMVPVPLP